jgi:hypothetical protein
MKKFLLIISVLLVVVLGSCDFISASETYTVTFTNGDGTEIDVQSIKEGDNFEFPTPPEVTDMEFYGWYYDGVLWSSEDYTVTSDMTFIAEYVSTIPEVVLESLPLSNGDEIVVSAYGLSVTKEDLYKESMIQDGMSYLFALLFTQMYEEEMSSYTPEQLEAQELYLIYHTDDVEEIASIQTDDYWNTTYIDEYNRYLAFTGVNYNVEEERNEFLAYELLMKNLLEANPDLDRDDLMISILQEHNLVIFDPILQTIGSFSYELTFDETSDSLVASIDGYDVTPEDLYEYMYNHGGTIVATSLLQKEYVLSFKDEYITEEEINDFKDEISTIRYNFDNNLYLAYGFSSDYMSYSEFLVNAFGVTSEEVLFDLFLYVPQSNIVLYDEVFDYDLEMEYISNNIDSYFDYNVDHVLIYVDQNFDEYPDDFLAFETGLTVEDKATLQTMLASFKDLMVAKTTAGMTFDEIVAEYNSVDETDEEWGTYIAYGFIMITESLGSITPSDIANYDSDFTDGFFVAKDYYETETLSGVYFDQNIIMTQFGVHYISIEESSDFESFTTLPSEEEFYGFIDFIYSEVFSSPYDGTMDADLYQFMEYFYIDIIDGYLSRTGSSMLFIDMALEDGMSFTDNDLEQEAFLSLLRDAYESVIFPADYIE